MTFVLGYDETPGAERALEVAIELAARFAESLSLRFSKAQKELSGMKVELGAPR